MLLKDFAPAPALLAFVKCYRIIHFRFDDAATLPVKAYPPKPEEVLHFLLAKRELIETGNHTKTKFEHQVVLSGQQTAVYKRYAEKGTYLSFQIVFQPTAVYRLTGLPSYELTNTYGDATNLFSGKLRSLHERLYNAESYNDMLMVADTFVRELAGKVSRSTHRMDEVSAYMLKTPGNISLDGLANAACLCTKQFKRKFNERVGVNPKTYLRIIRFNRAYNIKNAYPERDWLSIAVDCGYFDYQHLVKDYKDFTGLMPKAFHLLESKSPERFFGLAQDVYKTRINP